MFIAQVLVGPSKQLKQIIQAEHGSVKDHNWRRRAGLLFMFCFVFVFVKFVGAGLSLVGG